MKPELCPFCGVVTDVRHDTHQACIDALQSEITLTRHALKQTTEAADAPPALKEEDRQLT